MMNVALCSFTGPHGLINTHYYLRAIIAGRELRFQT